MHICVEEKAVSLMVSGLVFYLDVFSMFHEECLKRCLYQFSVGVRSFRGEVKKRLMGRWMIRTPAAVDLCAFAQSEGWRAPNTG